ncbi:leucine--tRNA ligase [Candidatus Chlorohelix sp.]|uniref:leucine--tRNA ligase n=1 Tax=Candidatus Chlorohelix sp. TaxID=3139201 RepID=UPI0030302C03
MDTQIKPEANRAEKPVYRPTDIESKWQKIWEEAGANHAPDDDSRPKFYNLVMFPYPSGDLHIGHWYNYTGVDVFGRLMRMKGYNVMQPLGFDAFGLPAENAAIKRGVQARKWTLSNIAKMRSQLKTMGGIWDWQREVITCNPDYYKWTEWFFLKLYEKGLAYRAKAPVNWCPSCQTVLANEQVLADGTCERCSTLVYKRDLEQWFFRITAYADRLLEYKDVSWPEKTMLMQRNWIGRSEGARVNFKATGWDSQEYDLPIFTTRPDTVYGITFFVLAPEHPLVEKLTTPDKQAEVNAYIEKARGETDIERQSTDREKSGVFIGSYVISPFTGEKVPIWISDYVLMGYGTGAIMAVPAHDQRDFEFARKFNLPIRLVYMPDDRDLSEDSMNEALVHEGHVVNSGAFNGLPDNQETVKQFIDHIEHEGLGNAEVNYRVRDWLISRQRYWGAPIPMVYCDIDGIQPVPEEQLPVLLPEEVEFKPTGESPLKYIPEFVNTTCPKCGGPARRETDTMDTFMCSSWYFLRYCSPLFDGGAFEPNLIKKWMPVDQYTGGAEHATMHLLYARFFTMALHDMGYLNFEEPFTRLFHQGTILRDSKKMSKSKGNVVAPDVLVNQYGADAVRAFLMFLGPFDKGGNWTDTTEMQIGGIYRFLSRVWALVTDTVAFDKGGSVDSKIEAAVRRLQHKTIRRVLQDLESWQFNTALSGLMEYNNGLIKMAQDTPAVQASVAWREALDTMLVLLAPLSPHITEELWQITGHETSIHIETLPIYDAALAADDLVTLVVQINGKLRERIDIPADMGEEEVKQTVLSAPKIAAAVSGATPKKIIYVPGKLVNIVL